MKRLNPVGSLFGFILTILLFLGLGFSLWYNRGLAFSPGPVTELGKSGVVIQGFISHADFEKRCSFCHEPLKSDLASKCMICHADVKQQIQTNQGIHGQIENPGECALCHPEHRGRSFDPTMAAYQLFDHSKTNFSLNWHQQNYDTTPMQCAACHQDGDFSAVENSTCVDCHTAHDSNFSQVHVRDFGSDCFACHDGLDSMKNFDHSQTGYVLVTKHDQLVCTGCHTNDNLSETPTQCKDCHQEPAIHSGMFDPACEACHTPAGWSPAILENQSFSHYDTSGFSLSLHQADYSGQEITCSTCHLTDLKTIDIQTCIDCHNSNDQVFMTDHLAQFGSACMDCHDGVDRLSNFDHGKFFPLEGKHATIVCVDCHTDNKFRGTPVECVQCHDEPEIHAGVFGLECNYCHSVEAWSPARLEQHTFPLNHGLSDPNTQVKCDACHITIYTEYTCYTCHEHQPDQITEKHLEEGISEQDLPACADCHPIGMNAEGDEN